MQAISQPISRPPNYFQIIARILSPYKHRLKSFHSKPAARMPTMFNVNTGQMTPFYEADINQITLKPGQNEDELKKYAGLHEILLVYLSPLLSHTQLTATLYRAKATAEEKGGIIRHEYTLIKGFTYDLLSNLFYFHALPTTSLSPPPSTSV